tara:strand:+ start:62196 stop:63647 length:1452 start_codon:yes stop_codon:yes gene_type:complete
MNRDETEAPEKEPSVLEGRGVQAALAESLALIVQTDGVGRVLSASGTLAANVLPISDHQHFYEAPLWQHDPFGVSQVQQAIAATADGITTKILVQASTFGTVTSDLELRIAPALGETVVIIGIDVTTHVRSTAREQKRVSDELRDARDRLCATIAALPDLLLETDAQGRFFDYHAPRSEDLYLQPEQFLGRRVTDLLPGPAATSYMAGVAKAMETGSATNVVYSLFVRGEERRFEARMARIDSSKPGAQRVLGVIRDVTSREKSEQELRERASVQEVLVNEVNHRVRNNLTAILGVLSVVRSRASSNTQTIESTLDTVEARIHAFAIAHDVLSDKQWGPISLKELCSRVISATAEGQMPTLVLKLNDASFSREVIWPKPAQQLALVLAELTTNALKHGLSKDGTLQLEVEIARRDDRCTLSVRDGGSGFPARVLEGNRLERNLGLGLIEGIVAHSLLGAVTLRNDHGAVTTLSLGVLDGKSPR